MPIKKRITVNNATRSAELFIYDDIGEHMFGGISPGDIARELKAAGAIKNLNVRIQSQGGDVFAGLAIYNQLVRHEARVTVDVDGIAASAASLIAMAGDEIRIAKNAFMMIHDPWSLAMGNAADLRSTAEKLDNIADSVGQVYADRTGVDIAEVRALMAAETWFDGDEAVAAKFADVATDNLEIAAHVDASRFRHPPRELAEQQPPRLTRAAAAERIAANAARLDTT